MYCQKTCFFRSLTNWRKGVNYCQTIANVKHNSNNSQNCLRFYSTIPSIKPNPTTQSISRWLRSLIFFWVNKKSKNNKIRDLHAMDNLNELCIFLSNIQNKDSTLEKSYLEKSYLENSYLEKSYLEKSTLDCLLDQRFETLYLLHKLLVRDLKVSIKHLVITLNSYTRLKSLFPGNINQIQLMSEELVEYLSNSLSFNVHPLVNVNEQDVSLLLNAMSKLNIRHKGLLKLMENLLMKQIGNKTLFIESFSPQGISLVMNALQKFDWIPSPYLLIVTSQFAEKIARKFTLSQLLVTCHAFWKLQLNEVYITPLLKHLDKMLVRDDKIDLKILSIALYTFGKLEFFPELSKDIIARELIRELSDNLDNYGLERENLLTNVIYGLSQLNWKLSGMMDRLFDAITERKLSTIGLATTLVSFSKLDHRPLISAVMDFDTRAKSNECGKYYQFLLLLFQRIDFTMRLAKTPEFTSNSSPTLITEKQLSNALFAFVLSGNTNFELYNYLINSSSILVSEKNLTFKGMCQLASIVPFFLTNDSMLSGLNVTSLKYLNQIIELLGDKNEGKNNGKEAIKSSKTHLSIASATRKVVGHKGNVFVEYKNVPYTIDIVVK